MRRFFLLMSLFIVQMVSAQPAVDTAFKTFAKKFTSLYPEPQHKIQYYNTGSKTAVLMGFLSYLFLAREAVF